MRAFRKNDKIFILDNVKRIEANDFISYYEIRFYYNDGTYEVEKFLGNETQMQATLTGIFEAMTKEENRG